MESATFMTDRKATGPLLEYIQAIGIGKRRLKDTEEAAWQEADDERLVRERRGGK